MSSRQPYGINPEGNRWLATSGVDALRGALYCGSWHVRVARALRQQSEALVGGVEVRRAAQLADALVEEGALARLDASSCQSGASRRTLSRSAKQLIMTR